MNRFLTYLVAIGGTAGFILITLSQYQDSASKRLYAQTAVIQANSAARQDLLAAMLPYTVMALGLIGLVLITGLIIFGIIHLSNKQATNPTQHITHNHIYLLPSGQGSNGLDDIQLSRRQALKQLAENRDLIIGKDS